ncbi:MAG: AAA family ATPase [Eubacteriales bacterium]
MSQTTVICFANNKGGSGKSTTCSNVGYCMTKLGKKVLLIDGDMQMNLSLAFFHEDTVLNYAKSGTNIYTAIKEQKPLERFIVHTAYEGLDMVPSSSLMSSIEYDLFSMWQREYILKKCMAGIKTAGKYDYILIDAPPTLGGWVMNIMCASDFLLIPVEATPWGLFGLANMFEFFSQVKTIAPDISLMGVAITKADERKNYFKQTLESLRTLPDITLFTNYIRVDSTIEWAQEHSKPVMAYRKSSRSAKEYLELAKEIVDHASR